MARSTIACMLMLSVAASIGGCARQDQTAQTDSQSAFPADSGAVLDPSSPAPENQGGSDGDGGQAPADTNAPVTGALADLRSQMRAEAQRLDRAVTAGNLVEVGASALRLRDAVVPLPAKAAALPAQTAKEVEALVTQVVQATETIRSRAAAGEIAGVRTENAQLQQIVVQVLKLTAGDGGSAR